MARGHLAPRRHSVPERLPITDRPAAAQPAVATWGCRRYRAAAPSADGREIFMLDSLRKGTASILVKVLLGLLILSFAAWGIGDVFTTPAQNPLLAKIGGESITASQFLETYHRDVRALAQQLGQPITADQARTEGLADQTLRDMVTRSIMSQAARQAGIAVSDDVVRRTIFSEPGLQTPGGRFDRAAFEQLLREYGITEQGYVESLRQDLAREQLIASIAVGAFAPKNLVEPIFKYREETRLAEIVVIAGSAMRDPGVPTDQAFTEFHRTNAGRYSAPELRSVSYLVIPPESLFDQIRIGEEQARLAYENRRDEFTTPDRREVEQLLFSEEDSAKAARDRAERGESFDDIAKATKALNVGAIQLGVVTRQDLPAELTGPAFFLPPNGLTTPVKTALGWHVLRVKSISPGGIAPYDSVKATIETQLKRDKAVDALFELSNKLEDEMAGGSSLEDAASKANRSVRTLAGIDRSGRDENGAAAEGIPDPSAFLSLAFTVDPGRVSAPQEVANGSIYFLRVNAVTPPTLRLIDKVRDRVVADWQRQQRYAAAEAAGKELAEAVTAGKPLKDLAAQRSYVHRTTPPLTRTSGLADPAVSATLVAALFEVKAAGAVVTGSTPDGEGYVVARLDQLNEASPEAKPVPLAQVRDQLSSAVGADILFQYQTALQERFKVSVYRERIENLDLNVATTRTPFRGRGTR
ncbi:MAG: hypothetical protein EXQ85_05585 [Alphaproteobacteria bacterium]|nr:hypothetical protein [Alphaproteobacteria bacterium]